MRFGILGPLEVAVGDRPILIGSLMQRRLLAVLLMHPSRGVATDRLVDVLWAGEPPANAQAGLHTYVSRLRRALGDTGQAHRIEACPPGYRLRVAPDDVDARRFERRVAEARAAPRSDPAETAARLQDALALWRGPAYAEFADEEFARGEAVRLDELRLAVTEDWADARLAAGAHAALVGELEALVAEHPFRERPRGQLMLALHRSGRQAEALGAYQRFRDLLTTELGLEPSASLQRLQADILRSEPSAANAARPLHGEPATDRGPGTDGETGAAAGNLPQEVTTFVGRHHESDAVRRLVDRGPLVTLTGPGGVGKTRLALRVAAEFNADHPDGVWLCQLAPVDADAVEHAVAATLGVQHRGEGGVADAVVGFLADKRLLLVLDNCEHVVDVAAALAERIVGTCPRVTVLATSRRPLGVPGEQGWPVPPLPLPGAERMPGEPPAASVELFADRAAAHHPGFALTADNAAAVAEICRQLDGLPLAIELAAGLLHAMAPAEIAARLSRRLSLLAHGRRTDPRHRSLTAVIDWSYQLLDDAERRLFDRLAVFAGTFDLAAAETVCADRDLPPERVAALLASLAGASMVVAEDAGATTRYRLLETLRQYADDRLAERGQQGALRDRHARHFVALADRADHDVRGVDEARGVATLERELDNLRAAHRWAVDRGDVDLAVRLASACYVFALYRLHDEVFAWAEEITATVELDRHPAGPAVWGIAAHGISHRGDLDRTRRLARRGLLAAGPDDPARLPVLAALTAAALYEGRLADCRAHIREGVALAERADCGHAAVMIRVHEPLALAYDGDHDAARRAAVDLRARAEELGNPTQRGWARYAHAEALGDRDPEQALALLEDVLAVAEPVRNRFLRGVALVAATSLRARHGSTEQALAAFGDVIRHWDRTGDRIHQWTTLRNLVTLLVRLGADEPAAVLLGAITTADTAAPTYGADAARLADAAATLRERLGDRAVAAAGRRGAQLAPADVVACAVGAVDALIAAPDDAEPGRGAASSGAAGG